MKREPNPYANNPVLTVTNTMSISVPSMVVEDVLDGSADKIAGVDPAVLDEIKEDIKEVSNVAELALHGVEALQDTVETIRYDMDNTSRLAYGLQGMRNKGGELYVDAKDGSGLVYLRVSGNGKHVEVTVDDLQNLIDGSIGGGTSAVKSITLASDVSKAELGFDGDTIAIGVNPLGATTELAYYKIAAHGFVQAYNPEVQLRLQGGNSEVLALQLTDDGGSTWHDIIPGGSTSEGSTSGGSSSGPSLAVDETVRYTGNQYPYLALHLSNSGDLSFTRPDGVPIDSISAKAIANVDTDCYLTVGGYDHTLAFYNGNKTITIVDNNGNLVGGSGGSSSAATFTVDILQYNGVANLISSGDKLTKVVSIRDANSGAVYPIATTGWACPQHNKTGVYWNATAQGYRLQFTEDGGSTWSNLGGGSPTVTTTSSGVSFVSGNENYKKFIIDNSSGNQINFLVQNNDGDITDDTGLRYGLQVALAAFDKPSVRLRFSGSGSPKLQVQKGDGYAWEDFAISGGSSGSSSDAMIQFYYNGANRSLDYSYSESKGENSGYAFLNYGADGVTKCVYPIITPSLINAGNSDYRLAWINEGSGQYSLKYTEDGGDTWTAISDGSNSSNSSNSSLPVYDYSGPSPVGLYTTSENASTYIGNVKYESRVLRFGPNQSGVVYGLQTSLAAIGIHSTPGMQTTSAGAVQMALVQGATADSEPHFVWWSMNNAWRKWEPWKEGGSSSSGSVSTLSGFSGAYKDYDSTVLDYKLGLDFDPNTQQAYLIVKNGEARDWKPLVLPNGSASSSSEYAEKASLSYRLYTTTGGNSYLSVHDNKLWFYDAIEGSQYEVNAKQLFNSSGSNAGTTTGSGSNDKLHGLYWHLREGDTDASDTSAVAELRSDALTAENVALENPLRVQGRLGFIRPAMTADGNLYWQYRQSTDNWHDIAAIGGVGSAVASCGFASVVKFLDSGSSDYLDYEPISNGKAGYALISDLNGTDCVYSIRTPGLINVGDSAYRLGWIDTGSGVYELKQTTNGGATWTSLSGGDSSAGVFALGVYDGDYDSGSVMLPLVSPSSYTSQDDYTLCRWSSGANEQEAKGYSGVRTLMANPIALFDSAYKDLNSNYVSGAVRVVNMHGKIKWQKANYDTNKWEVVEEETAGSTLPDGITMEQLQYSSYYTYKGRLAQFNSNEGSLLATAPGIGLYANGMSIVACLTSSSTPSTATNSTTWKNSYTTGADTNIDNHQVRSLDELIARRQQLCDIASHLSQIRWLCENSAAIAEKLK